jgi:hypothetical protein
MIQNRVLPVGRNAPHKQNRPLSAYDLCAIVEFPTESGPADYALCVWASV